MNVLLVDDEQFLLDELRELVEKELPKADLHCFKKAKEAIVYASDHKIDIAFLDINMRVVDGISMAKQLQVLYPKINIIFCTGYQEYMADAFDIYCSGYLMKPLTKEKVRKALAHLRYQQDEVIDSSEHQVYVRCFGSFDVFCDNKPVEFAYARSRELLAYLIDRDGVRCSTRELEQILFGDENHRSYFNRVRLDLLDTFEKLGVSHLIGTSKGFMWVDRSSMNCDYFRYKDHQDVEFTGEYMSQFSFGENTRNWLLQKNGL